MTGHSERAAAMDGLRGVAIGLVVWFHIWLISWQSATIPLPGFTLSLQPLAETGFVGVELFFFLSGFCIFYPYARGLFTDKHPPDYFEFYRRRWLKIVPSYLLAIAVLIAVGWQKYDSAGQGLRDVAFHLIFIHNWFAATMSSIDGVLWSLGVEVQFYVLFPLIVWCAVRRPAITFGALIVIAIAFRAFTEAHNHVYFAQLVNELPAEVDLFAVGMAVAYLYWFLSVRKPELAARKGLWTWVALAGAAGFIALIYNCYGVRWDHNGFDLWKSHWRTVLALSFGLLGLGSLLAHSTWVRIVANPLFVFLGAISYNLYIWHQVIGQALARGPWPGKTTVDPHGDPHWQLVFSLITVPLVLLVAAAVTYGFERPIMHWRRRSPPTSAARPAGLADAAPLK
jgi:peptidoglycan/LPS O-acetylase OafA/YrhL